MSRCAALRLSVKRLTCQLSLHLRLCCGVVDVAGTTHHEFRCQWGHRQNLGFQTPSPLLFLPALLYFATPRPPLYPVPAYLLVNAMVDVLEMWINR